MTKQSIKEFFRPSGKLFFLGAVTFLTLLFILFTAGSDLVYSFLEKLVDWPVTILRYLFHNEYVTLFFTLVWFFILFYTIACLFANLYGRARKKRFLSPDKNINRRDSSLFKNIGICFLLIVIAVFFTFGVSPCCGGKAKSARIVSAIAQDRTVMAHVNGNDGNYDSFQCGSEEMKPLCEEIDKNYGQKDGREPKIAKNKESNSDAVCIYSPLPPNPVNGWIEWISRKIQKQRVTIWYCADSQGHSGITEIDPGSAGYCVEGVSAKCPPVHD